MNKEQKAFHKSRRNEFAKLIGKDSIALIFGSTFFKKSYDADFEFKQLKNFYYLTGFTEANSAIMIAPSGLKTGSGKDQKLNKEILFVQKKDPLMETWSGRRLGFSNVNKELGIESGKEISGLKNILNRITLSKYRKLYINLSEVMKFTGEQQSLISHFIDNLNIIGSHVEVIDASFLLGKMRSVKTPFEIKMIWKACDITGISYNETLKMIKPGLKEYQVQASLEYHYKYNGSLDNAYYPIVAGGENACILHYDSNNMTLKDGDLLLIDSGSEYEYYCSDITRTFPINGKFTKEQKVIYSIVLKANKECIKKAKAGMPYSKLNELSNNILAEGLRKAGLLKDKSKIKTYSLHGLGHHIGLDTHDAVTSSKTLTEDNDKMKAGNVFTIEPGLYFPYSAKEIPAKYRGIGVRIEDDILITRNGCVNLTSSVPKEIEDIEKAMSN